MANSPLLKELEAFLDSRSSVRDLEDEQRIAALVAKIARYISEEIRTAVNDSLGGGGRGRAMIRYRPDYDRESRGRAMIRYRPDYDRESRGRAMIRYRPDTDRELRGRAMIRYRPDYDREARGGAMIRYRPDYDREMRSGAMIRYRPDWDRETSLATSPDAAAKLLEPTLTDLARRLGPDGLKAAIDQAMQSAGISEKGEAPAAKESPAKPKEGSK